MNYKRAIAVASIALTIGAFVGFGGPQAVFAATVEFVKKSFLEGFYAGYARQFEVSRSGEVRTGTLGSSQTFFKEGSCNLTQSVVGSHAATTSKEFYCAVTGVQSGDTVLVSLPRGAGLAGSGPAGFTVNAAFATATDMIGASVYNGTGAATTSYAQATTSVRYVVFR